MTRVQAGRRVAGLRLARGVLLASLAGAGSVVGCASQQKKEAPIVRGLQFEGNHALSSRQIEKKILTADTGWWPLATKQYFDPVSWEADLARIVRLYEAYSYYQARIAHTASTPKPPDGVKLKVVIDVVHPTKIGSLYIRGLEALPAADQAAVTLTAHPGLRYRCGGIDVKSGPEARIPPLFVWEQVRLAIPDGSTFSDAALEEAERRVFAMGVFGSAKVTIGTPDDAAARVPVVVVVREAPFHTLRTGGGFTIDQVHNEVHLVADWTNRNFLGGMRKLTLHAMAGWAFIPDLYAVATNDLSAAPLRSGPVFDLGALFEQPRFVGRPSLRQQSGLEFSKTIQQTYDNLGSRLSAGVIWQLTTRLSIFPVYRLEFDHLNGSPINSAATAPLTLGCHTTSGTCNVWLSYLEQIMTWDHRDKPLEPRSGFYTSVSLQEGGGPLQGDFDYFRLLPDLRGYFSLGDDQRLTFAARLRVGELWTASGNPDDSAVVTRFYGGGANGMRGFSERRLSPLLEAPVPNTNPVVIQTVPIGGNGWLDGSLEARYSVTSNIRVAAFVDVGQVTTGLFGLGDLPGVLWAVGLGLRYLTPIGPLRVDLARRLPFGTLPPLYAADAAGNIVPQSYTVDQSCFGLFAPQSASVVTDGSCVLQISIGEAF